MLSCSARSDVPPLSGDDNDNDKHPSKIDTTCARHPALRACVMGHDTFEKRLEIWLTVERYWLMQCLETL